MGFLAVNGGGPAVEGPCSLHSSPADGAQAQGAAGAFADFKMGRRFRAMLGIRSN